MPATPPYLKSILEEHFEELQMLWELRQTALTSRDYHAGDVAELDQRIEAHVDALLLGGEHSRPLLEEGVAADEPSVAFAAGYVLLRMGDEAAARRVADALTANRSPSDGLRQALCHGPIEPVVAALREAAASAPAPIAVAALEPLAFHGQARRAADRLAEFARHESPAVRRAAWRIAAILGTSDSSS